MSIQLSNIYCRHWLKTPRLKIHSKYGVQEGKHHLFHIQDTIQYHTLQSQDYTLYTHLIRDTNQPEHSVDTFKKLQQEFDIQKMETIFMTILSFATYS